MFHCELYIILASYLVPTFSFLTFAALFLPVFNTGCDGAEEGTDEPPHRVKHAIEWQDDDVIDGGGFGSVTVI